MSKDIKILVKKLPKLKKNIILNCKIR
jgi:hypothetical protein